MVKACCASGGARTSATRLPAPNGETYRSYAPKHHFSASFEEPNLGLKWIR